MRWARWLVVLAVAAASGLLVAVVMSRPTAIPGIAVPTPCFVPPTLPGPLPEPVTVAGPAYGEGTAGSPTRLENQNKLWFHDGSWWAAMVDPKAGGASIHQLVEDAWIPTSAQVDWRPDANIDVLQDGDVIYMAAGHRVGLIEVYRFEHQAAEGSYALSSGFPVTIDRSDTLRVTIAKDGAGRLWLAYVGRPAADGVKSLWLITSEDDGLTWSTPFVPPVEAATPVTGGSSDLVAFDGHLGVLWGNARSDTYHFAVHRDDDPIDEWSVETALEGPGMVDDHVSIAASENGSVYAAIKTRMGDQGEPPDSPLVVLLQRSPDGGWEQHTVSTVAEGMTRATVAVNDESGHVFVIGARSADIAYKRAALQGGSFAGGRPITLVRAEGIRLRYPSVPGHAVDSRSGLMVLASGGDGRYYHAVLASRGLSSDGPPITCPPAS